jgi:NADPH-dependent 2,4-dienoyl-CoA reductase/sulfur reductase-like enzyme
MGLRSEQASDSILLRLVPRGSVDGRPHVVIVGAGFGGLTAAKGLAKAAVEVTLIDRENHHLFQPLLYQVSGTGPQGARGRLPDHRSQAHAGAADRGRAKVAPDLPRRPIPLCRACTPELGHRSVAWACDHRL